MNGTPDAEAAWTEWLDANAKKPRLVYTADELLIREAMFKKGFAAAAARVRAAQVQAWDEGKQSDHTIQCRIGDGSDECICENPYRLDAADEFQDSED